MKKLGILLGVVLLVLSTISMANAAVSFSDGFETAWTGDYASGWIGTPYRHGDPPGAKMVQITSHYHSGSYGLKLIADSVVEGLGWDMFWAAVEVDNLPHWAMDKQYNPYVSAWYYDELGDTKAGQTYAVPDWQVDEDWTDVQFGGRNSVTDNYYYATADKPHPGWNDTEVGRTEGWHHLKFQLSSADGYIYFYIDEVEVGQSTRNDYTNIGTAIGLHTMFDTPLSDWGENKPFTIWDDFEVGSDAPVPIPGAVWLLGSGLLGLVGLRRKFQS